MARWRGHRPFGSGAKSPDRAVSAGLQRKRGGNQTGASTDRSALLPCSSRTLSDCRNMASVNEKEFVRKFWNAITSCLAERDENRQPYKCKTSDKEIPERIHRIRQTLAGARYFLISFAAQNTGCEPSAKD